MRCAQLLSAAQLPVMLIEAQDRLGGRVQTDEAHGFLLDRGFQVLLTEYPEARDVFDYQTLRLRYFEPGALVRLGGRFVHISDPLRKPSHALATIRSPIGSLADKLKILRMRNTLARLTENELFAREETTAADALRDRWGFSSEFIERFFRPFFGGILLDRSLRGSSRMMEYVFQMFSTGYAALPAGGMGQLSSQMASTLASVDIRQRTIVQSVKGREVILDDNSRIEAHAVVIAVDGPESNRLVGSGNAPSYVSTRCYYFATEQRPRTEPLLILNGESYGPINSVAVLSNVSSSYSSSPEALISVTVLENQSDTAASESAVRAQLREWFGARVQHWRHIRTYHIPTALPDQSPPFLSPVLKPVRVSDSLYRCGDYVDTASINGALRSGRRAAEAVLADLGA